MFVSEKGGLCAGQKVRSRKTSRHQNVSLLHKWLLNDTLSATQSGLLTQWGPYDVSQAHGRVSLTELHSGWPQDTGIQVPGVEGGKWLGLINGHHGDTRRWKVPPTHTQTMKHMFCCSIYTYTLKGQESCSQSRCLHGQLHPWLNGTDFVCVVCDFVCFVFFFVVL